MDDTFRVLVVCTGNVCRSPAGQQLLVTHLARLLPEDARAGVLVHSAGTRAPVGRPVHPLTARALTALGVPAPRTAARELAAADVAQADLVLAAAREHRAAAAVLHPPAVDRVFTITEFARLAEEAARRMADGADPDAGRSVPERARAVVAAARDLRGLVRGEPGDDDLADPITAGAHAHRDVVGRIDRAMRAVAAAFTGAMSKSNDGQPV